MTPDPNFYFESRGHRRAYGYLRYAVLEGESFVVLTGDTGVGKTTVVYQLLKAVESQTIVSALLRGTQLDAAQLLAAVLTAFRANVVGDSLDELRAGLQAFLTTVTASGRRALIVVDEAQHLLPDAIQELTAASTASARDSPLQVLLVGQPELRTKLGGMPSFALREPVFLFCDLGRLSPSESRAYIELRLRHVEWEQSPLFSSEAHEKIFEATEGVPRLINRICDRLLSAAFQQQLDEISAELVRQIDDELRSEVGDLTTSEVAGAEKFPQPQDGSERRPAAATTGLADSSLDGNDAPPADRSDAGVADEIEPVAAAHPGHRRTARASRGALIGAFALVLASLLFWWGYESQQFSRDQRVSALDDATHAARGTVSGQGEKAGPATAAVQSSQSVPAAAALDSKSTAQVAIARRSDTASAATSSPPVVVGSLASPTSAADPTDAARGTPRLTESEDTSRAVRGQAPVRPARARATRRNLAPVNPPPEQVGPSETPRQAAQPRPTPERCNAAVVALGLCTL